jgi:hypothetical protein
LNRRLTTAFFITQFLTSIPSDACAADINALPRAQSGGAAFLVALLILAMAGIGYWAYQRFHSKPSPTPETDPFSDQFITHTFISALPALTPELNLEIARSWQMETLERSETKSLLGLKLGTNTAQIRVPVTYRYHLRLQDS